MPIGPIALILLVALGIIALTMFMEWIQLYTMCAFSGVRFPYRVHRRMKKHKLDPKDAAYASIRLSKCKINVPIEELATAAIEGYTLTNIVNGMVAAQRTGQQLTLQQAKALDKDGIDLFKRYKTEKANRSNDDLVGLTGVATSDLAPDGLASFDDLEIEVLAIDPPINEGQPIRIHAVQGDTITVTMT